MRSYAIVPDEVAVSTGAENQLLNKHGPTHRSLDICDHGSEEKTSCSSMEPMHLISVKHCKAAHVSMEYTRGRTFTRGNTARSNLAPKDLKVSANRGRG
jgi:hypothetical protein